MRDLKADLEYISDLCPVNTFITREAINRAIAAEYEKACIEACNEGLRNQLASLDKANDQQRASIQDLSCQVAGLREGLVKILNATQMGTMEEIAAELLSSPDPSEKIRAVVKAAIKRQKAIQKSYDATHHNEREMDAKAIREAEYDLDQALAELEGVSR